MSKRLLFSVTIKDCDVETFAVGGNGGAGKDTSNSGVRVTHPPSGATGVGRDHRSQFANKRAAFRRMAESKEFTLWHKLTVGRLMTGKSVEQSVEESMGPKHIRVEGKNARGQWERLAHE